jgi:hypothetical protein
VNNDTLPAALKARILEAAKKEASPTRKAVTFDTTLLLVTAAAAAVNVFLAAGGVNLGPRPAVLVASTVLGRATIALASTWAALARGGSMLGRSLAWLVTTTIVTPLAIAGWMLLVSRAAPGAEAVSDWHCAATATVLGLAPLAAFVANHRQSDLKWPIATGAALGAAASAWADPFMVLHCAGLDLGHRLFCHLGPSAVLVAAGALLGAVVIRPSVRSGGFETTRSVMHRYTNGG